MTTFDKAVMGKRLKLLAEEMGLKNIDVARALSDRIGGDVSKQSVSSYLNGNTIPSIECLIAFSEIFHVTVDYLIGKSNDKNPYAAEASAYTGLSPQALTVLHDMFCIDDGKPVRVFMLDKIILDGSFLHLMTSLYLLSHSASKVARTDWSHQFDPISLDDQSSMKRKNEFRTVKSIEKCFGESVILSGFNALEYKVAQNISLYKEIINRICGIKSAKENWTKTNHKLASGSTNVDE